MEEKQELLNSIIEYIPKLHDAVNQTIEDFKYERIQEAYNTLVQIFEGLQWCIEAIYLTQECHEEAIDLQSIQPFLQDMMEGLENNDVILLRDILEYEIKTQLETWYEKIKA